jgi:hypothetical protein
MADFQTSFSSHRGNTASESLDVNPLFPGDHIGETVEGRKARACSSWTGSRVRSIMVTLREVLMLSARSWQQADSVVVKALGMMLSRFPYREAPRKAK